VGLYYGQDDRLTIAAADESGQPLTEGVELADDDRLLKVAAGSDGPRQVWVRIAGDDSGAEYTLWLWLKSTPPE
jgi:hypothetical protein